MQYFYINNHQNLSSRGYHNSEPTPGQKSKILASSITGTGAVLALLAKKNGYSLNPKNIIKTPIKDLAIFKSVNTPGSQIKPIDLADPKNIIALAAGSVAGGFIGGVLWDKNHVRAKKQEALTQILGNILTPVGCVALGAKLFNKYSDNIQSALPKVNTHTFSPKTKNILNKIIENIPRTLATLSSLTLGIYAGNKVCNFINEKLYDKKCDRKIKTSDFAPHVDDLCMAVSITNPHSKFASKMSRIIPLALVVPGYNTGIARE